MPTTRKTPPKRRSKHAVDPSGFPCSFPGCALSGDYKAPLSPMELRKHRWFCIDHVREYNANWNYFEGMHASQVEDFMKSAMLGERQTWQINSQRLHSTDDIEAALHKMMHGAAQNRNRRANPKKAREQSEAERKSLAVLNLEGEVTLQEIKKQYKLLVKKHHPDVNQQSAKAEERFKRITEAYQELLKLRKKSHG